MAGWSAPTGVSYGPYAWGGYSIDTNIPMPRLGSSNTAPDLRFRWHDDVPAAVPEIQEQRSFRTRDGDVIGLSLGGDSDLYRYETSDVGLFLIEASRGLVHFYPHAHADPMRVEHVLVNAVLATYAGLSGRLAIHASAVSRDGVARVFAGPSGVGKSTAAWSLIEQGWDLLADDVTVIVRSGRDFLVEPGARTVRLEGWLHPQGWDNKGKTEVLVPLAGAAARVSEIVFLGADAGTDGPLEPATAARSLLALQAGWPRTRPSLQRRLFADALEISARARCFTRSREGRRPLP